MSSIDALILSLAPAFVAGFAVQRVAELCAAGLDAVWAARNHNTDVASYGKNSLWSEVGLKNTKMVVTALLSVVAGFIFATNGIKVLGPLGYTGDESVEILATILVISAGTEGINSVVKWLGYSKDDASAKSDASASDVAKKESEAKKAEAEARTALAQALTAEHAAGIPQRAPADGA